MREINREKGRVRDGEGWKAKNSFVIYEHRCVVKNVAVSILFIPKPELKYHVHWI